MEADKEIEEYRALKEKEFTEFERSVCVCGLCSYILLTSTPQRAGTTQTSQSAIDKETEDKLAEITKSYEAHKDAVVQKLLDRVVLVKPELHRNLRKIESP